MNFVALNRSIVILAQAHNPTILHPSFLSAQHIVPADWTQSEPPVCTPPFSIVKYSNGIIFTAELNKLMVLANSPNEGVSLPELVVKYIATLPHVNYSAVGINISGYLERQDAASWMIEKFLKKGAGNNEQLQPSAAGLKLLYSVQGGACNISLDAGSVQLDGGRQVNGLIASGNYHLPLPPGDALENAKHAVESFPQRLAHFAQVINLIFNENAQ